ncbi:hypothetical protein CAPTEDRAFT_221656 [Capitella teleta]|uniref:VWFA domain-containing protein n=1 Tax=Capitella teleta TaxID=283909 RepID=R7T5X0_CAPTE|nr:hypothetical protein CAPTEDRAFT_221656 [Capitella teleta]|eukprot:ELT88618.1 hypothetical protein CAPTEDRAFT_221656 [Capitella teleta]
MQQIIRDDLEMLKLSARLISKKLTESQNLARVNASDQLLTRCRLGRRDFYETICDEAMTLKASGNPWTCRPEIAFVVDTSPSIGRRTADTFIVPLLSNFENELRRLPNAPGDGSQGSNLHLVTFNKAAVAITLNSIGASYNSIMKTAQKAIKNAPITGGTCLSCGIEAATKILQEKGIHVLTVGVIGKKDALDVGQMTDIADNTSRFWKTASASESSKNAIDIVDLIAGLSCF